MLEQLKKLDKKFLYTICIIIAVPILLIIILAIIRGCSNSKTYENYEKKMISAAEKYVKSKKKEPKTEGESYTITLDKLVNSGYIKSTEKYLKDSTCKGSVTVQNNGASVKENEGGFLLYYSDLKCKDYKTKNLSTELISKETKTGAGLYKVGDEYIFKGQDDTSNDKYVENYINFYGTLYRIMKIDSNGDLKLIKIENEARSYRWDDKYNEIEKHGYGENDFETSLILENLYTIYKKEKTYSKNAKKYIVSKDLCIGKRSINDKQIVSDSDCETILEKQLVSLPNVNDFALASLDQDCKTIDSGSCRNFNYLSNFFYESWTMTGIKEDTYQVYYLASGMPYYAEANEYIDYNMVIYISGHIIDFSGSGTEKDPYVVK